MSRRWAWIWIVLAFLCAGAAGWLAFFTLEQQTLAVQQNTIQLPTPTPIPSVQMPVAARDLPVGTVLTDTDILMVDYPEGLVAKSAMLDVAELHNRVLIAPVAEGDIFRSSVLRGGSGSSVSSLIQKGMTLFAMPLVDLMAQSGQIKAGDRIDLLLTLEVETVEDAALLGTSATKDPNDVVPAPGKTTGYALQNIEVFRVIVPPTTQDNPDPAPTGLLLLLKPEDAVLVKAAKDSGGTLDLVLRGPEDADNFRASPLTERELIGSLDGSRNGGR